MITSLIAKQRRTQSRWPLLPPADAATCNHCCVCRTAFCVGCTYAFPPAGYPTIGPVDEDEYEAAMDLIKEKLEELDLEFEEPEEEPPEEGGELVGLSLWQVIRGG